MVKPTYFGFNAQTAKTNVFQHKITGPLDKTRKEASKEFKEMVRELRSNGIDILVLPSRKDVATPDAVFPNNWFSSHEDKIIVLYPMLTPSRRAERQPERLVALLKTAHIEKPKIIDLTKDEKKLNVLEGTGSLVLDREHSVAFAMESQRTSKAEFEKWCRIMKYKGVFFHAYDAKNFPVYHTNIIMTVGRKFAVVCLDAIKSGKEREVVRSRLEGLGKHVIPITMKQMYSFCGNLIQLISADGAPRIVLSAVALSAFTEAQKRELKGYGKLVVVNIPTIEKVGGGSARCMIAEIFR